MASPPPPPEVYRPALAPPGHDGLARARVELPLSTKAAVLLRAVGAVRRRYLTDTAAKASRAAVGGNPKFVSAADAAALINDEDVIGVSGLATNQVATALYRAVLDRFTACGHPRSLTGVIVGGMGARGKAPGSLDDWAVPGLLTRFFVGHLETFRAIAKYAAEGHCEIQILPQGTMCLAIGQQATTGANEVRLPEVLHRGTMIDPRMGRGSPLCGRRGTPPPPQYVRVDDTSDEFVYSLPRITVALVSAPAADRRGNVYLRGCSTRSEVETMAQAANRNGGRVIVQVGMLVPEGYGPVAIPWWRVDAVVVNPQTEQAFGAAYASSPYTFLTVPAPGEPAHTVASTDDGIAQVRFLSTVMGASPKRSDADMAVARLGAHCLDPYLHAGMRVQIGTGLPEEVAGVLHDTGALARLTSVVESGVFGGLPAPGPFFGASVSPTEMVTSMEAFKRIYDRLGVMCVGALEVDSAGCANVTRRSDNVADYIGPGGFIDLTASADVVLFSTSFRNKDNVTVDAANGRMVVPGLQGAAARRFEGGALGGGADGSGAGAQADMTPCFVERVREVTFNGQEALKRGQVVLYVCHVGALRLTERGLQLEIVMPGVDPLDVVAEAGATIVLPPGGVSAVRTVDASVVTGRGFRVGPVPARPVIPVERERPRRRPDVVARSDTAAAAAALERRWASVGGSLAPSQLRARL